MDDFILPKPERPKTPEPEPKTEPEPIKHQPAMETINMGHLPDTPGKSSKRWWHFISYKHTHLKKWQWALLVAGLIILVAGAAFGAFAIYKHLTKTSPQAAQVKNAKPTTEPSRLTGILVKPELNKRPITGVMIENSLDARPQSGLLDAGVVYEAIAEGGITRFLALYEEAQPNYIGPVRSVRPYYLDFALPFQASVAHVGGSPEALKQVKTLGVRDLDQFFNAGAYQRITSRFPPHNVYTSSAKLDKLEKSKGYTKSDFTSFARKKDRVSKTPKAKTIDISISGYLYSVHYVWDPKSNSYKRSEGGAKHLDARSHKQLHPRVVIAVVMDYGLESDNKHSQYGTTGSGPVFIFQDGTLSKGLWKKASRKSQISFVDGEGNAIRLNAGQTWITLVGSKGNVSYKP